jgi:hypothetical protein
MQPPFDGVEDILLATLLFVKFGSGYLRFDFLTGQRMQGATLSFSLSGVLLQNFSGLGDHWFINHFAADRRDSSS